MLPRLLQILLIVMAAACAIVGGGAAAGLARSLIVLKNYDGYREEVIRYDRLEPDGAGSTYLVGRNAAGEELRFEVFPDVVGNFRYGKVGPPIHVWRNPSMPPVSIQREGLNIILADQWEPRENLLHTRRVSAALIISGLVTVSACVWGVRSLGKWRTRLFTGKAAGLQPA